MKRNTDSSYASCALRKSGFSKLHPRQFQFYSTELLIEALKKDLRVIEISLTIYPGLSGDSKKGLSIKYASGLTKALVGT